MSYVEREALSVCIECGGDYPTERKRVAAYHSHLCVDCAEGLPIPDGRFTLVPMHKGAYQPVRADKIYEFACNPKNYNSDKGGL